jgi:hypothetical protein
MEYWCRQKSAEVVVVWKRAEKPEVSPKHEGLNVRIGEANTK